MKLAAITQGQSTLLRAVLRTALILVTAFGFQLTAEQVAAIQLAAEAVLQAAVQWQKTQA